jgi:hypothetical protein
MDEKKHPCPDCQFCQWCSDIRCAACLGKGKPRRKKLSIAEQIALYEKVNREFCAEKEPKTCGKPRCCCKK